MQQQEEHKHQDKELDQILSNELLVRRRAKIICTIGPSCWEVDKLVQMLDAGMCVARLNFSQGDHKSHAETHEKLKKAFALRPHLPCAVMLDTKGPEIRTGLLVDHKPIQLQKNQLLEISVADYTFLGTPQKIACSYKLLPKSVKVGCQVLIADGTIVTYVKEIQETAIIVEVQNEAKLGEKKNMCLPGCVVELPTVTEQDKIDIVEFGLKHNVDLIALSFTRRGSDIEDVRALLGDQAQKIKIISKIENQEGLHNMDDILKHTDGIMVARGDLGMEIPPQKVFIAQKWMIHKCLNLGVPVVTATQMMESMVNNPRPTRAEASDVANAILDGTDAVMLSGETANGGFPIQAVEIMSKICQEAELFYENQKLFWGRLKEKHHLEDTEALAAQAVQLSFELDIELIICLTQSGHLARQIAKFRPRGMILAITTDEKTVKTLSFAYAVYPLYIQKGEKEPEQLIEEGIVKGKQLGICKDKQKVVVIYASTFIAEKYHESGEILVKNL